MSRRRTVAILALALVAARLGAESSLAQEGVASWYGGRFHGRTTSNGERYDMNGFTAAHRTLPFGTRVLVTNLTNGRQVVVRINDRGPFVKGRIIDLSRASATLLGMLSAGTAKVRLEPLAPPSPGEQLYAVQIGAFVKEENALRVLFGLRADGLEAVLERTKSAVTRVLVDNVTEAALQKTLKRVTALGFVDALVRKKESG